MAMPASSTARSGTSIHERNAPGILACDRAGAGIAAVRCGAAETGTGPPTRISAAAMFSALW